MLTWVTRSLVLVASGHHGRVSKTHCTRTDPGVVGAGGCGGVAMESGKSSGSEGVCRLRQSWLFCLLALCNDPVSNVPGGRAKVRCNSEARSV